VGLARDLAQGAGRALMSAPAFDPVRAAGFRARLGEVLNGAALALGISIGHRTGLFDVMARLGPATSRAIAHESGLDERYLCAWLAALGAAEVLRYDATAQAWSLPREHATALARSAEPACLAAEFGWIPVLASVEDELVECFERGGGVPREAYARLAALEAEASGAAPFPPSGVFERVRACLRDLPISRAAER
jgi:hypothetical protein